MIEAHDHIRVSPEAPRAGRQVRERERIVNAVIALWLWFLTWAQTPRAECTRCGGHHPLSRCPWPAEALPGAIGRGVGEAAPARERRRVPQSGME